MFNLIFTLIFNRFLVAGIFLKKSDAAGEGPWSIRRNRDKMKFISYDDIGWTSFEEDSKREESLRGEKVEEIVVLQHAGVVDKGEQRGAVRDISV